MPVIQRLEATLTLSGDAAGSIDPANLTSGFGGVNALSYCMVSCPPDNSAAVDLSFRTSAPLVASDNAIVIAPGQTVYLQVAANGNLSTVYFYVNSTDAGDKTYITPIAIVGE